MVDDRGLIVVIQLLSCDVHSVAIDKTMVIDHWGQERLSLLDTLSNVLSHLPSNYLLEVHLRGELIFDPVHHERSQVAI